MTEEAEGVFERHRVPVGIFGRRVSPGMFGNVVVQEGSYGVWFGPESGPYWPLPAEPLESVER